MDLVSVVILVVQDIRVDPMDMAMAEVVGAKVVEPKVVEAVAEVVEAKMLQVKVVVGEDIEEVEEARGLGVDTIHIHDKW